MKKMKQGCHALIVALIMAICCNFIAFGDEIAAPAESAVESVMDDTADTSASESTDSEADEAADADSASEPDSNSEPDDSEVDETAEPEEKKDDDQSSFDSGKKEDHSSFDEWDFPTPEPEPQPEPAPQPTPEPEPQPEPEKPEIPVTPVPEPEKPEPTPVAPVVPEPEKPEPTPEPERWHNDDDDDDDIIVVIPKKPVITETDEVPVIKTFEVSSGDTLPTPEEPVVTTEKASSPELPKTGDSSLALYAFMASAFGLAILLGSSFVGRHNADETADTVSAYPQMCCRPQETEKTGKSVSVTATRSSGTQNAPSRFGLRRINYMKIVLALTHPGWGLFVSESR